MIASATKEDVARIEATLARIESAVAVSATREILTTEEARRYTKQGSDDAFYRWAKRWGVESAAHGRWSRAKLDLALEREAGLARTPATIRRRRRAGAA